MWTCDERRFRYRECLEMETQYGQFLPCEHHDDLDLLAMVGSAPSHANHIAKTPLDKAFSSAAWSKAA